MFISFTYVFAGALRHSYRDFVLYRQPRQRFTHHCESHPAREHASAEFPSRTAGAAAAVSRPFFESFPWSCKSEQRQTSAPQRTAPPAASMWPVFHSERRQLWPLVYNPVVASPFLRLLRLDSSEMRPFHLTICSNGMFSRGVPVPRCAQRAPTALETSSFHLVS